MLDFVSDKKFLEPLTDAVSGTTVAGLDRLVGDAQKEDQSAKEGSFRNLRPEKHLSLVFTDTSRRTSDHISDEIR